MNYIEPVVETVSDVDGILGYSRVEGAKEWVFGLISKNGIPVGIQDKFKDGLRQINEKNYKDLNEFKSFFLFHQCLFVFLENHGDFITMPEAFPDCFDAEKISIERLKVIQDWFTQRQDNEPEVFKPYVANILSGIHSAEEEDEAFSKAFRKKSQEVRDSSTFIERARYYVRLILQSLPKKEHDENPFFFPAVNNAPWHLPPTGFFESDALRIIRLIAEMEEIPEKTFYIDTQHWVPLSGKITDGYDISATLFLICGKEIFLDNLRQLQSKNRLTLTHQNRIIRDELDSIVQGSKKTEADWQKTADTLRKEFTDIIASGMERKEAHPAEPELSYAEKITKFINSENLVSKLGNHGWQILNHYLQKGFTQQELLDFLLSCFREPGMFDRYPLKHIQFACEKGILTKETVLEDLRNFFAKYPESFEYHHWKELKYFIEPEDGKYLEEQTSFFMSFFERAVHESEGSFTELYNFFIFRRFDLDEVDSIFSNHPERLEKIITRCSKTLHYFSHNINHFDPAHYGCVFSASLFIWEKTSNIWKALKPLILAFRNSKEVLLDRSLGNASSSNNLVSRIIFFITIKDKAKLKELRHDMANDFANYLRPTTNMRQEEQYMEIERNEEGFDPYHTEPSPIWRFAYARSLTDLGVEIDKRRHLLSTLLLNVSKKDPSKKVRKLALKGYRKLSKIRNEFAGEDHRKRLLESFWWLRYAHMLSLGAEVDPKEANIRRITEWR